MNTKLLIFDSHPVQYRVPVWKEIERSLPGSIQVVYASDCSVRGYTDTGFGKNLSWDEPMLSGYKNTILNCENGTPLSGWNSLTGKGVKKIIDQVKPSAILLTGINYRYDMVALLLAKLKGIPVWLRCETQDEAHHRSGIKLLLRSFIYKIAYSSLNQVFFIGELNKQHYLNHGINPKKFIRASYSTVDRFTAFTDEQKSSIRSNTRKDAGIDAHAFVIGFSGKFIYKKNPGILFKMLDHLPPTLRSDTHLYFMGSGELETDLRTLSAHALEKYGVKTYFSGFVNQSELAAHYLAMDIMVLPSRRMGETWGLVANEAMQAGCGVIVSDAVGSSADFKSWERFRIFKGEDAQELANCVNDLYQFKRDFIWAANGLKNYSIQATANAFIKELETV